MHVQPPDAKRAVGLQRGVSARSGAFRSGTKKVATRRNTLPRFLYHVTERGTRPRRQPAAPTMRHLPILTPDRLDCSRLTPEAAEVYRAHQPKDHPYGDYTAADVTYEVYVSRRGHTYGLRHVTADAHGRYGTWDLYTVDLDAPYNPRGYVLRGGGIGGSDDNSARDAATRDELVSVIEASEDAAEWAESLPAEMGREEYEAAMRGLGLTPVPDESVRYSAYVDEDDRARCWWWSGDYEPLTGYRARAYAARRRAALPAEDRQPVDVVGLGLLVDGTQPVLVDVTDRNYPTPAERRRIEAQGLHPTDLGYDDPDAAEWLGI